MLHIVNLAFVHFGIYELLYCTIDLVPMEFCILPLYLSLYSSHYRYLTNQPYSIFLLTIKQDIQEKMMVLRSCPIMLLMSGLFTMITGETRIAKDMTLEFYRTLFHSSVSEETNTIDEVEWREYTEWDWNRSAYHETNETKKYPFIVCDDKALGILDASVTLRQSIAATDGLSLLNTEEDELTILLPAVINSVTNFCVVGSLFSTKAANLNYVVQPISFLMKINSGTTKFSGSEESSDTQLEYYVLGCPGIDEEFDEGKFCYCVNL